MCSLFAWTGLGVSWFAHSRLMQYNGASHTVVIVSPSSIATLAFGLFSFAFSLFSLSYDFNDRREWLFFLWCALPLIALFHFWGYY